MTEIEWRPFYAMFRLLHLKDVLISTIHSSESGKLNLNPRARAVVRDIKNPFFPSYLCRMLGCVPQPETPPMVRQINAGDGRLTLSDALHLGRP